MIKIVAEALARWDMATANAQLVATRENQVYRVVFERQTYALRLHRPEYRTDAELWSELEWMAAMARAGVSTPAPIPASDGVLIHVIDGVQVDILNWLSGVHFNEGFETLPPASREAQFAALGLLLAQVHHACDAWQTPNGFVRPAWDSAGLIGDTPLWGPFWENPALSAIERGVMLRLRGHVAETLANTDLDYGLIHADAVRENVLRDGHQLHLIDYDDGGFGYRLFDIATALVKAIDEPDYLALREALLSGYLNERSIDIVLLDQFLAIRAATYVGWIAPRAGEPGAAKSVPRLIDAAMRLSRIALGEQ